MCDELVRVYSDKESRVCVYGHGSPSVTQLGKFEKGRILCDGSFKPASYVYPK